MAKINHFLAEYKESISGITGLCGSDSHIEQFGHEKQDWLGTFLPFKNGTPSQDTFRRVFSLIDPSQIEEATVSFLMENISAIKQNTRFLQTTKTITALSVWTVKKKKVLAGNMVLRKRCAISKHSMSTMHPQTYASFQSP